MYRLIQCNEKHGLAALLDMYVGMQYRMKPGPLMGGCLSAPPGHVRRHLSDISACLSASIINLHLKNLEGHCNRVMERDEQYTEKIDTVGPLHPCISGSLMPRCPSGAHGHLGMPVGLNDKFAERTNRGTLLHYYVEKHTIY